MNTYQKPSMRFFEEQFMEIGLVGFGNHGRILFGLVRVEELAANMAAAWLQGGFKDDEVAGILDSDIPESVANCAEYIDIHHAAMTNGPFIATWKSFLEMTRRFKDANGIPTDVIHIILLLLPLAASALRSSHSSSLGSPPSGDSCVDRGFHHTIRRKAAELGYVAPTDLGTPESLASVEAALKHHLDLIG